MGDDAYEKFQENVDRMISEHFVMRKFSGVKMLQQVPLSEIRDWMEDPIFGVKHPIDDSGPHFLLNAFADLRQRYMAESITYPWCSPRGRDFPDLPSVSGEIVNDFELKDNE